MHKHAIDQGPGKFSLLLDVIIHSLTADGKEVRLLDVVGLSSLLIIETEAIVGSVRGRVD